MKKNDPSSCCKAAVYCFQIQLLSCLRYFNAGPEFFGSFLEGSSTEAMK